MRCLSLIQEVIPEEVLHEFAVKATYDTLPDVLRTERWYASHVSVRLPAETPPSASVPAG